MLALSHLRLEILAWDIVVALLPPMTLLGMFINPTFWISRSMSEPKLELGEIPTRAYYFQRGIWNLYHGSWRRMTWKSIPYVIAVCALAIPLIVWA